MSPTTDQPLATEDPETRRARSFSTISAWCRRAGIKWPRQDVDAGPTSDDPRLTPVQHRLAQIAAREATIETDLEVARSTGDHASLTRLHAERQALAQESAALRDEERLIAQYVVTEEEERELAKLTQEGAELIPELAGSVQMVKQTHGIFAAAWREYCEWAGRLSDWERRRQAHQKRYGTAPAGIDLQEATGVSTAFLVAAGKAAVGLVKLEQYRQAS